MFPQLHKVGFQSCSASTTATNSHAREFNTIFEGEVMCDWLSFRHDFAAEKPSKPIEAGKTLKLNSDGVIEWEKPDYVNVRCPSSDTSVRIKCDGRRLYFSGNIGRFSQPDNLTGLPVITCFEKAHALIKSIYPNIDMSLVGTISRRGTISEYGTYLTRIDLASNFETDSYHQLSQVIGSRKINQRLPVVGKYGPTWGYEAKRGQFWKAKLYDKQAEMDGKRTPYFGNTKARFEVQLGSTYLRKYSLDDLMMWRDEMKTENVIYGKFANQILVENATAEDWSQFPVKLRSHAVLWRDGTDPRSYLSQSQYYKVRSALLEHGLDISRPCNVLNLTRQIKTIELRKIQTLRAA